MPVAANADRIASGVARCAGPFFVAATRLPERALGLSAPGARVPGGRMVDACITNGAAAAAAVGEALGGGFAGVSAWQPADGAAVLAGAPAVPGGYGELLVTSLAALVAVCALAWLALRFGLRRLSPAPRVGSGGPVRVLARVPLEARQTLYVLEVGGKTLLVGAGDRPLSVLAELDSEEVAAATANQPRPATFRQILKRLRTTAGSSTGNPAGASSDAPIRPPKPASGSASAPVPASGSAPVSGSGSAPVSGSGSVPRAASSSVVSARNDAPELAP